jgi:predicted aspartyl protease
MRWRLAAVLIVALTVPARTDQPVTTPPPAAPVPVKCQLLRKALLDMDMDDSGRITVPVGINGVEKRMLVDTGATESLIAAPAVADLKLATRGAPNGAYMQGFGGRIDAQVVDVAEFGLGRMKGKNFTLFVETGYLDADGLLGGDFLYFFDLDFDFANAKLSLFSPDHCPGKVMYWSKSGLGVVPFEIEQNHIMIKVQLDGQEVNAILDTGAADTVMSLERASRAFDLDKDKLRKSRHYPFKTLSFGDVNVSNPAIALVPDDESRVMGRHSDDLHMILGMGVLRRLHLYISYKEKMIYATPATQY